jgi:hypothetical protein
MSEPTIKDVIEMLQGFKTEMSTLKSDVAALKDKSASSSDNSDDGGPRDLDRPPKF